MPEIYWEIKELYYLPSEILPFNGGGETYTNQIITQINDKLDLSTFQADRTACAKTLWQKGKESYYLPSKSYYLPKIPKWHRHSMRWLLGDPGEGGWGGVGFAVPRRDVLRNYRHLPGAEFRAWSWQGAQKNMLAVSRWRSRQTRVKSPVLSEWNSKSLRKSLSHLCLGKALQGREEGGGKEG